MSQDRILHRFRLDSDVPLGGSCAAVLQQVLDKDNVVVVVLVDLRGIILPEAMGADPLISQIIAGALQDHLDIPYRNWEDPLPATYHVPEAVVLNKLVQDHRNGEATLLARLLLHDV